MRFFLIHSITILSIFFVFTSCGDDDNPTIENGNENTIIGKWKLIQYEEDGELFDANDCEQKSIIEFKSDNTFTDIAVIDNEMDSSICEFDGFGISGTFEVTNSILVKTTIDVIAVPDDLNNPQFIEDAKGENDPQNISFDNENLVLLETIIDGTETLNFKYVYEKTTNDFFEK